MPPLPPSKNPGPRGRGLALVAVAVLILAVWAISQAMVRHNQMQDCIDAGRRDCASRLAAP